MNDIEMPFTSLKQQIDALKGAADKCHMPSVYVHTFKIASIMEKIKHINLTELTENQKKLVKELDEAAFKQFERISTGRCSCKVSKDI
jgi:hypothetical protein